MNIKFISNPDHLPGNTPPRVLEDIRKVQETYQFRINSYYQSLINWEDPRDPIRRLIIPTIKELNDWGTLDPSGEENYTVIPGLEHKYNSTVLMLISNVCGGICRYCFRKRVFMEKNKAVLRNIPAAAEYISSHTKVTNVLLTGGDPLMLSTHKLRTYTDPLIPIDHVRIIRIGSKMPAFDPFRISGDPELLSMLKDIVEQGKQIYIMTHFNHLRELTPEAKKAVRLLRQTGAELCNQTPIIKGINDSPDALADLFRELSFIGIPPYYIFQCRPASGNSDYAIPIEKGYEIFEEAFSRISGLAKRARFVMSHMSGKIEIIGLDKKYVYMKYHRAADDADSGRFFTLKRNPEAYWLDDYKEYHKKYPLDNKMYKSYGPE